MVPAKAVIAVVSWRSVKMAFCFSKRFGNDGGREESVKRTSDVPGAGQSRCGSGHLHFPVARAGRVPPMVTIKFWKRGC